MKIIIAFMVFATTFLILAGIWFVLTNRRRVIEKRINMIVEGEKKKHEEEELDKPFKERIITPFLEKLSQFFSRFMPKSQRDAMKYKLNLAGNPFGIKPHEFSGIQYLLGILFAVISAVVIISTGLPSSSIFIIPIVFAIIGYNIPQLYLKIKAQKRQKEIDKSLPGIVDLLAVSVESGLGFDAAISRVTSKTKGVLTEEFNVALHEIKMGKPRREALRDMVKRANTDNLANFISAVLQADGLGVSMSQMLRIQSETMRVKRRQKAEEEAMKAPIKMIFPMVFFIFPCLFIVLLGPAFINIFTELF